MDPDFLAGPGHVSIILAVWGTDRAGYLKSLGDGDNATPWGHSAARTRFPHTALGLSIFPCSVWPRLTTCLKPPQPEATPSRRRVHAVGVLG